MRLEYLMYLCEAAKSGSINSTAEKLNISQQGLNRALKSLQTELDCDIISTSSKGIKLTEEGKMLLDAAEDILNRWKLFEDDLHQAKERSKSISGVIKISITLGIMDFFLTNTLPILTAKYPDIVFEIDEKSQVQILSEIENNIIDLGILGVQYSIVDKVLPELAKAKNVKFVPLYQYKLSVIAGHNNPIAKYKSISMKTLLKHDIVLPSNSELEKDVIYRWLKLYGEPHI